MFFSTMCLTKSGTWQHRTGVKSTDITQSISSHVRLLALEVRQLKGR